MQRRDYRFSDYRLAGYVVVAAVIAGGVAFGLDRAFAPTTKVEANGAPPKAAAAAAVAASGAVRQIPIARTSAADLGDPEGKLTPVYPANPGKDLPIKDTPIIQPAKPAVAAATTTGSASAAMPAATAAPAPVANAPAPAAAPVASAPAAAASVPQANAAPAANACNVAVCSAAYRSFRESDCTYQPFEGPRRFCEGAPDTAQTAAQPQQSPPQQARPSFDTRSAPQISRRNYDDALRDAERTVRRLPPPGRFDDPRGVVVMESPEQRYDMRRNWIVESDD